jgi:FAD/FMN-containing dehydrogenase/Fe-S oxidoreductase
VGLFEARFQAILNLLIRKGFMGTEYRFREIPYNYTSFSDKEIILKYFDEETWCLVEALRTRRVTGRSAKLSYEIIGDIFVIDRNPYIYEDCLKNARQLRRLREIHETRLRVIEEHAHGDPQVETLLEKIRALRLEFFGSFKTTKILRTRILSALTGITARRNIKFSPFHRAAHATDATDWRVEYPAAVVYPDSVDDIPGIVRAVKKLKLSLIPRGGGTGLTGGAIPVSKQTIVLNVEKLNRIHGIEFRRQGNGEVPVITLEAGVITDDAIEYCERQDYIFATDPTSAWASTIGGNIAENAGGKKCVMWGTAIDNLYTYRLVDANGDLIEVRRRQHPYRKIREEDTVTFEVARLNGKHEQVFKTISLKGTEIRKERLGKDITNKALNGLPGVQKEGGDGIIVSAQFVLYRPLSHCRTLCLEFFGNNMRNASHAIVAIKNLFENREGVYLTALEHFDEKYVEAINYRNKSKRTETPKAILLIDVESNHADKLADACAKVAALIAPYNAEVLFAGNSHERTQFWSERKQLGAIARHTNAFKLNEDVVIPLDKLPDFADFIERLNFEKELQNVLRCINAVREFIIEYPATAEDEIQEQRASACLDRLREVEACTGDCLMALKGVSSEAGTQIFRKLQEGEIVIDFDSAVVPYFRKLFHGYTEFWRGLERVLAAERRRRLVIATHMHAGDGNVHVNIPVYSNDYLMMQEADDAAGRTMREAVRLGGVVSGEHGIGLTKLKFVERRLLDDYQKYKKESDPEDIFNPGKLSSDFPLHRVYTPSFNLLEREAIILEATDLEKLSTSIASCVRCGKCKSVCSTHYPGRTMMYNPRNKIFGVGLVTEAVLYYAQSLDLHSFKPFSRMREIADHCTMCHKCAKPCPVKIDFGDITLGMRRLLAVRKKGSPKPLTDLALLYLGNKKYFPNKFYRLAFLRAGYSAQRAAHCVNKPVAHVTRRVAPLIGNILDGKFPACGQKSLREQLQLSGSNACFSFENLRQEPVQSVVYFPGCGSERMFPEISTAVVALLRHAGVRVVIPPGYLCCGYPFLANGKREQAEAKSYDNRVLLHRMADTIGYMNIAAILVSCGTCYEMLQKYEIDSIFGGATLMDINEYLVRERLFKPAADRKRSLKYHEPCHTPLNHYGYRKTIHSLFGQEALDIPNCCGEAGTLALSRPDIAGALRERKRASILGMADGAASEVMTTCPSCVMGIAKNSSIHGITCKSLVVYAAEQYLGKNWQMDFIRDLKRQEVEKILL